MHRSRLALAALPIILTIAGCVTVDPGASAPPSSAPPTRPSAPSSSPVPTATAAASASTAAATPTASASIEPGATPEPTASPTAVPDVSPSADPSGLEVSPDSTLIFDDSFDEDANGWGVVEVEGFGSIEWFDGALAFVAESVQGSLQSTKPVPGGEAWVELAGSADFTASQGADSIVGIYCSPGDGTLIGGLVSVDGDWAVIAGTQDAVTIIDRGELPEGSITLGETATVAFQCSGAAGELLPMVRLAVESGIVATTEIPLENASMSSFTTVGLWVEPITPPMLVGVDEVQVVGRDEPRRENLGPPPTSAP